MQGTGDVPAAKHAGAPMIFGVKATGEGQKLISTRLTDLRDRLDTKLKEQITPEDVEKQIEALLDIYQEILQNAYEYCKRNPWFKEGNARKDAMKPIGRRMNQGISVLGNHEPL